jgi:hypothetical protein
MSRLSHGFLASSIAFGVTRYSRRLLPSNLIAPNESEDLDVFQCFLLGLGGEGVGGSSRLSLSPAGMSFALRARVAGPDDEVRWEAQLNG